MVIELREYRQFHELTAVTDCAVAEGRWDLLSRFPLMSDCNLYRTAEAASRILYELLPIFVGSHTARDGKPMKEMRLELVIISVYHSP